MGARAAATPNLSAGVRLVDQVEAVMPSQCLQDLRLGLEDEGVVDRAQSINSGAEKQRQLREGSSPTFT